jgi:hypothetical protein
MKLAEALMLRTELQVRAKGLVERAEGAARFQEGESPAEDATTLIAAATDAYEELGDLVARINHTNASCELDDGTTLTRALAQRDALGKRRALLTKVADHATSGLLYGYRQMRSELRWEIAVPVADLRSQCDRLARDFRELDARIQQANWATDLDE